MNKFKHDILLRIVKSINIILITIPFAVCWFFYYADHVVSPPFIRRELACDFAFPCFLHHFGRIYDAFLISIYSVAEIMYSQILSAMLSDGVMYVIICLLSKGFPICSQAFWQLPGSLLLSVLWARGARRWYFRTFEPQPTAIIYDERRGISRLIEEHGLKNKYDVQYAVSVDECLENIDMLANMSTVFLSGIHSHERNLIIKYCVANDINAFVIPRVGDTLMSGAHPFHMFHLPMLRLQRYAASPEYLFIKRALDIAFSTIALIVSFSCFCYNSNCN